ncbi:hypothetical protein [Ensifer soli]|uniref:hypothetical protein n=1 Tax=Ciceribacter sp. sgz301302 TaxID=3342379 RepID=UPI0035BB07DD
MTYSTAYISDAVCNRLSQSGPIGFFIRVAPEGVEPLRIWTGAGDIPARFDAVDPSGTVYYGAGRLNGLPTLAVMVNGGSDAVDFTLSGIDPQTARTTLSSIPPVNGAPVTVGLSVFDNYYQPLTEPIPIWTGTAARLGESSPVVTGDQPITLALSLSVVAGENMRARASRAVWSSAHQKSLYLTSSDDRFCDNTALLARGVQPVWPNY